MKTETDINLKKIADGKTKTKDNTIYIAYEIYKTNNEKELEKMDFEMDYNLEYTYNLKEDKFENTTTDAENRDALKNTYDEELKKYLTSNEAEKTLYDMKVDTTKRVLDGKYLISCYEIVQVLLE